MYMCMHNVYMCRVHVLVSVCSGVAREVGGGGANLSGVMCIIPLRSYFQIQCKLYNEYKHKTRAANPEEMGAYISPG